jgi:hypothetical protein
MQEFASGRDRAAADLAKRMFFKLEKTTTDSPFTERSAASTPNTT